jgi:hypothetical protein
MGMDTVLGYVWDNSMMLVSVAIYEKRANIQNGGLYVYRLWWYVYVCV